ncbi:hypothetical protein F3Y22_tig00110221pilonHSYRG00095 [Hibiscus syriacus]|uniref:DNA (Cytosine-5)-methyltransferase DRM1/2 n=1 Tax=Hibiscus syriacus TaxID=106335 RepID=A0A6A3B968_HIBSY|nr:hypothetical protein F3Y22_tig00110221pilonHSYRG00095 [Hibiscus syriacus]
MGYSEADASIAMERCGPDSSIAELTDFICAAQMTKAADALLPVEDRKPLCNDPNYKKRQKLGHDFWKRKKSDNSKNTSRRCYWASLFLLHECGTCSNWCLDRNITVLIRLSVILTEKIRKDLEAYDDEPPSSVQKYVLDECRKWNLLRVGRNKVIPLEPDEVEILLEVAFYCLGIPLKVNVQELNDDQLEQLMSRFGEFNLVVGSILCNNLTGRNKPHRDELEDFCWCIFLQ